VDDLNAQAGVWVLGPAGLRLCPEDETLTVSAAFAQERERLLELPGDAFPTDEIKAVPSARDLLAQAVERGEPLGRTVRALTDLLECYGVAELTAAIADAMTRGVPHPNAVRQAAERRRHAQAEPPPLPVALPDHVKHRDVPVRPHKLDDYDTLMESDHDDC